MSLQELAAVTQERQIACGLPIGDLRGFGRVRADAALAQLALDRAAGVLGPTEGDQPLLKLSLNEETLWVSAYVPGTNVIESTGRSGSGELRVVDFMALAEGRPGQAETIAAGRFVRLVTCTEGEVSFDLACLVGEIADQSAPTQSGGDAAAGGGPGAPVTTVRAEGGWHLACSRALAVGEGAAEASVRLSAGESVAVVIAGDAVEGGPSLIASALHALGDTIHYWTWWSDRCRYKGDDFDAVLREALSLKLACAKAGLQVEHPGAGGFAPAPMGEVSRAAARFLELGYRHECAELLAVVHAQLPVAGHARWACEASFRNTLQRYLDKYGNAGLPASLVAAADVPPPQSRTA